MFMNTTRITGRLASQRIKHTIVPATGTFLFSHQGLQLNGTRGFASSSNQGNNGAGLDATTPNIDTVIDTAVLNAEQIIRAGDPTSSMLGYGPSDLVIRALDAVHAVSGLDWWVSIVGVTLALRTCMLPLALDSIRNSRRMASMKPEMERLQEHIKINPPESPEEQLRVREQFKSLQEKHGVKMYKSFLPLFVQMPVFVSFFFGLRKMSAEFPSFADGGALWFTDLTVADTTYALPLLAGATFLATVELGGEAGVKNEQTEKIKNVMRFIAVAMVPLTMNQPQGVFIYWVTSNIFTLFQSLAIKTEFVKGYVDNHKVKVVEEPTKEEDDGKLYDAPPKKK